MNIGAPFQKIPDACKNTGLSQPFLWLGCRKGTIQYIMSGNVYLINVPALLEQLDKQSRAVKADG